MHYRHCGLSNILLLTVFSFQWLHVTYWTLFKLISISFHPRPSILALSFFAPGTLIYWIYSIECTRLFFTLFCDLVICSTDCSSLGTPFCLPSSLYPFLLPCAHLHHFEDSSQPVSSAWGYYLLLSFCSPSISLRLIGAFYHKIWIPLSMIPIVSVPLSIECVPF